MSEKEQKAMRQGAIDRMHGDGGAWTAYRNCKAIAKQNPTAAAYVRGWEGSGAGDAN